MNNTSFPITSKIFSNNLIPHQHEPWIKTTQKISLLIFSIVGIFTLLADLYYHLTNPIQPRHQQPLPSPVLLAPQKQFWTRGKIIAAAAGVIGIAVLGYLAYQGLGNSNLIQQNIPNTIKYPLALRRPISFIHPIQPGVITQPTYPLDLREPISITHLIQPHIIDQPTYPLALRRPFSTSDQTKKILLTPPFLTSIAKICFLNETPIVSPLLQTNSINWRDSAKKVAHTFAHLGCKEITKMGSLGWAGTKGVAKLSLYSAKIAGRASLAVVKEVYAVSRFISLAALLAWAANGVKEELKRPNRRL